MTDKIFYDTNILVYAYDEDEPKKRLICKKLVEDVFNGKANGVISNQVLAELFNALTSKMKVPISKETASHLLIQYIKSDKWIKVNYTSETIIGATMLSTLLKVPFWDALITETARENAITIILTENEKDFSKMPGVKVTNPLK